MEQSVSPSVSIETNETQRDMETTTDKEEILPESTPVIRDHPKRAAAIEARDKIIARILKRHYFRKVKMQKLQCLRYVKPTNIKKVVRDNPKYVGSVITYSVVNQLAINSKRNFFYPYAYERNLLDALFFIKKQKGRILLEPKKSSKSPLDWTRVQLLFECIRIKYSDFSDTKLAATLNQKCTDTNNSTKSNSKFQQPTLISQTLSLEGKAIAKTYKLQALAVSSHWKLKSKKDILDADILFSDLFVRIQSGVICYVIPSEHLANSILDKVFAGQSQELLSVVKPAHSVIGVCFMFESFVKFHVVVHESESEVNSPKRLRIESRKFLLPAFTSTRQKR
uniref:Uncharacterized protein n=1 Tax=Amphimedon queenslandica TaxID=400682 RepID=A0A1X7UUW2_AMPQE